MNEHLKFDYNSTRPHLLLAEYGRNVQNMIQYISTLPTKEERNTYAQAVIELMGFLNPHLRDVTDFKHKLWDHLFVISDFKLDVDSPYPIPSPDTLISKPRTATAAEVMTKPVSIIFRSSVPEAGEIWWMER